MKHSWIRVRSRNATRQIVFLGPVPFDLGKSHAEGWCGPVFTAQSLKQILVPRQPVRTGQPG
jgi:hypothetical protein